MAVTKRTEPVNYSPIYGPLTYTVYSTGSLTEDRYRYIVQMYDSDSGSLGELKSFPNPQHGYGRFDVGTILQSYVSEVFNTDDTVFNASGSIGEFRLEFGEEYYSGSTFIRNTEETQSVRQFFNGSPFYNEYETIQTNPSENPILITSGSSYEKYPLTSKRQVEYKRGTKQWLYYLSSDHTNIRQLEVRDDTTSTSDYIDLPASLRNNTDGKLVGFRTDVETVESGSSLTSLTDYSIRTVDDSQVPTSEWIYYTELPCTPYDLYSLYYLNRWGGIDSFSFSGRQNTDIEIERDVFRQSGVKFDTSGNVIHGSNTHTVLPYHTEYRDRVFLRSDWVSYHTKVAATDLMTSPLVWMEDKDGIIIPVRVATETFSIESRRDGLINIQTEVIYEQPIQRQRN